VPTARQLAIDTNSGLYLWNEVSRRVVATLTGPSGLSYPAFSPDGTLLAAAGNDNEIYLWDIPGLHLITTLQTLPRKTGYNGLINTGQITGIAFSPDSRTLAVTFFGGTGSYVNQPGGELWDIADRRIVAEFPTGDTGDGVVFSPNGTNRRHRRFRGLLPMGHRPEEGQVHPQRSEPEHRNMASSR
jgi:hypothetical protein